MKAKKSNLGTKRFDQSFKYRVIDDLLCTGDSAIEVGERYGVTPRTIYEWLRTFGIAPPQQLKTIAMNKKEIPSELEQTLTELKRENARLKVALFHAEAEALAHKTLLEEVANRYHIEVKNRPLNSTKPTVLTSRDSSSIAIEDASTSPSK